LPRVRANMRRMRAEEEIANDLIAAASGGVHLMGVAGVGMAGLAAQLHWIGFDVTGCDLKESPFSEWARRQGVEIFAGHSQKHLSEELKAVVRSTAVPADHPELLAAEDLELPVLRRGNLLAAIVNACGSVAVAGTHGKTTTAAMLAQVLRGAGMDAGFFVGAMVDRLQGASGFGSDIFVAEADESDGTLACYRPERAILTNADIDHLEHYDGEDSLWNCFRDFVSQTRKNVVYNYDDLRAREIASSAGSSLGYGFLEGADVRGADYRQSAHSCEFKLLLPDGAEEPIELPVAGIFNASNALAVCAFCSSIGIDSETIARELALYRPPRRRFEHVARVDGVEVYMDYSHHPTEIKALLQSVQEMEFNRLVAVFQPHRYTRTLALAAQFPAAFHAVDRLVLAPVFAASEEAVEGGSSRDLLRRFEEDPEIDAVLSEDLEHAWRLARDFAQAGDLLLLIGAGDIEQMAEWIRPADKR